MLTLLIDSNYLLHRQLRMAELADLCSSSGLPTGGVFGFLRSLHSIVKSYKPDMVVAVFDGGISKRRRELYPAYKGARYRDPTDPLFEEMDAELQQYLAGFSKQRRMLQVILPLIGVRVIRIRGWEADDLIYALTNVLHRKEGVIDVVSDDKDMAQLVRDRVNVIRPMAGQLVTTSSFFECFETSQHLYGLQRAILGDPSDSITSIANVGKGTAETLLYELGADYLDSYPFPRIKEYCEKSSNKRIRLIASNFDIVIRNYRLMQFEFEDMLCVELELSDLLAEPSFVRLAGSRELLAKMELHSITREFISWIVPFQKLS